MKAFTSIFRQGRRRRIAPMSLRKRPRRSFASTFAPLEGRPMLSVVGPVPVAAPTLTATTAALIESTSILTVTAPASATPQPGGHSSSHGGQQGSSGSGGGQQGSSGSDDDWKSSQPTPPDDPVSMDVAKVSVDGQSKLEFALADFDTNEVFVREGFGGSPVELGPAQGIDHPDSVTLADVTGDGIPDLIVANTNGNNILVFPGLPDGQFGPEEDGGQGFAVGADPVSVTVNYVGGNVDDAQFIVANAESNSVTILSGQAVDGAWVPSTTTTIETPSLPSKTLLYDVNGDGLPDLLVCNTGSNDVTMYSGTSDGSYDPVPVATFDVGVDPDAMFVGPFDRRLQPDLVTVNAGSNDLTFIGNVFGPQPTTQTISSDGVSPDAAFAFDPTHSGELDLVVANGGDGHMAIFRGGNDGLQLAGVITQASLPTPTAVVPASYDGESLDFFAASAGNDAALLLQFDLGVASAYLPGTSGESPAIGQSDAELFAELMPFDRSSLDLIAVLWSGGGGASSDELGPHEPSTITTLYSPTEGQGGDELQRLPEDGDPSGPPEPETPAGPSPGGSIWARVVSGVVEALDRPHAFLDAIAARDALDERVDRADEGLARLDPDPREVDRPLDDAIETTPDLLEGGTIRLFRPEGAPSGEAAPADSRPGAESLPFPGFDGVDAPATQGRLETVPLISTALLLSTRLIIKASPPKPPSFGKKSWFGRFVSLEHDRRSGGRPGPV